MKTLVPDVPQSFWHRSLVSITALLAALIPYWAEDLNAQIINTTTPFVSTGDRYFENFGVGFGFGIPGGRGPGSRVVGLGPNGQLRPNIAFQQNNRAIPPFGGFNPGAGASIGFGRRGAGGGGFNLGLSLAKGNTRVLSSQAPSITTMNGASGSIFNGSTRPFVVGNIPVVGSGPGFGAPTIVQNSLGGNWGSSGIESPQPYENGVTRALRMGALNYALAEKDRPKRTGDVTRNYANPGSTATRSDLSVTAIKAMREKQLADAKRTIESVIQESDALMKQGKRMSARLKLRAAKDLTDDPTLLRKLDVLIRKTRGQ